MCRKKLEANKGLLILLYSLYPSLTSVIQYRKKKNCCFFSKKQFFCIDLINKICIFFSKGTHCILCALSLDVRYLVKV